LEQLRFTLDKVNKLEFERDGLERLNRLFDVADASISISGLGSGLDQTIENERIRHVVIRKVRSTVIDAINAIERELAELPMPSSK
jgi:hypothetical protein